MLESTVKEFEESVLVNQTLIGWWLNYLRLRQWEEA